MILYTTVLQCDFVSIAAILLLLPLLSHCNITIMVVSHRLLFNQTFLVLALENWYCGIAHEKSDG